MALILKSKKQAQLLKDQQKSNGLPYFKPKYSPKGTAFVFICPPKNEDSTIVTPVKVHEAYGSGGTKLAGPMTSVSEFGETCDITKLGWELRNKYKDSKNEKLKKLPAYFLPKTKNIIFVIDQNEVSKGIQQWQAPQSVADFIKAEVSGNDDGVEEGDMSFAHPTKGKLLKFTKTGEKLNTSYTNIGWAQKTALDLGEVDEDKLVEMLSEMPDVLGGLFRKPTKEQIQDYKDFLDSYAEKNGLTLNWKNTKKSQLETEDAADETDEDSDEDSDVDNSELDLDDEDTPKNKKSKKLDSKKSKKDDDDEEDESGSDSEEDEKPAKGKSKSKQKDEDDEDIEVDLDDEDDED